MRNNSVIYVIAATFLGFVVWAYSFNINEAVRAQGKIVPVGRVQVVQIADGGTLGELLVSEGDSVFEGQVIARLDNTRASARRNELDAKFSALTVARVRAEAEVNGNVPNFLEFPSDWGEVILSQKNLYEQKQDEQQELITALKMSLDTARSEYDLLSRLAGSGDTSNLRLIQAQKDVLQREKELLEVQSKFKTASTAEIAQIDQELFSLRFQIEERNSVVEKTNILAPKDGIISSLNFTTIGASMSSGEEFASIAPINEDLIIEAQIKPVDVGRLVVNLPVAIKLDAFDAAIYGNFEGTLKLISADASKDVIDGREQNFFKAQIVVDWSSNSKVSLDALRPGMTATLDIVTGERSVLTYLLKPIIRGVDGVFIER